MPRVSTRALARPFLLLAVLSAATLAGCGDRPPAGPEELWPLSFAEPGVLGYAALSLPPAELSRLLEGLLGWAPAGLASDRPLVAVRLESATFGGPIAVIAPLVDPGAFTASLASSPCVEVLGEGRYRVRLPRGSALGALMLLSSTSGSLSPASVLSALQQGIDTSFPLQIERQGDLAFAVPSFEALSLCRGLRDRLGGPAPAPVVLSVDLARVQSVYAEPIRAAREQLRALISGARVGAPLLMGLAAGRGLELPVNWELLWALLDMFEARQFAAAQLRLSLRPSSDPAESAESAGDLAGWLGRLEELSLRVRLEEGSRLRTLVESLRPAAPLDDAWLEAGADPSAFASAFAQWSRPVAAVVKGEGPPCDRYVRELADLLGGWDGRLAIAPGGNGEPVLLVALRDSEITLQRWLDWLQPLLATAHVEGLQAIERLDDGALVLRDDAKRVALRGRIDTGVLWLAPGDAADPPSDLLNRFRGLPAPAAGAALRASFGGRSLQISASQGELQARLTLPDRDR